MKGFTLIEMIIIIAIVGLLSTLLVLAVFSSKKDRPCDYYENRTLEQVPARCIKYFNK